MCHHSSSFILRWLSPSALKVLPFPHTCVMTRLLPGSSARDTTSLISIARDVKLLSRLIARLPSRSEVLKMLLFTWRWICDQRQGTHSPSISRQAALISQLKEMETGHCPLSAPLILLINQHEKPMLALSLSISALDTENTEESMIWQKKKNCKRYTEFLYEALI